MHYLYLFISIATEIIGTSFLKTSEGFTKLWPTLGTLLSFGICFYFLSLTIKFLPLNITYATWAGLGLVLTTIISVIVFKENVNLISIISIGLIVIGVVLLNVFGESH
ncbi:MULTISPECIES: quaternary ammonium compound efflux SMR transporter QacG [Bacteria]|jgi:small multidrug resistance pump|uniref:Quaternary ammonium compound-resistance protein QacG n=29 Tax=cellular organisms TaxID=131567 RepID=QACG_STAS9|nr:MULTISPECIES: quaternary ammonium compound efflux SMR transporter QacG [Staphylococcaceae]O87866.1 RecName: Full=Quaternary ammonium compound-resistance protein QacG; AltName: Full=Quaternary ammonium determinant G [Staphylococcus sp. ST94]EAG8840249.1 quaternary ammonium compound efflux SMR transporter QacG [Listeria monocytogenes]QQT47807.1 quaternary ammonium compound efflux SMR transporter QacG [Sphingobacterium multivorum]CAA76542.1 quaternary ammonium compound-resistance protein [Staph